MVAGILLALSARAAEQRCVKCHPKEVSGYQQSAMAHSLSKPSPQPDAHSSMSTPRPNSRSRFHSLRRDSEVLSAETKLGAENRLRDRLRRSRIRIFLCKPRSSVFHRRFPTTRNRKWDIAPGMWKPEVGLFAPVTLECFAVPCGETATDSRNAEPVSDAGVRREEHFLRSMPWPGEAHRKNPVSGSSLIRRNSAAARETAFAKQCHLAGETRIPNPESIADISPDSVWKILHDICSGQPASGRSR